MELGVKFTADVPGLITGIRYYKSSTNTGTHTATLWSSTGALLATATFTNETVSGWQQVNFAAPVAVAASTVYVASYHTNVGHYALNDGYFTNSGFDNPPLHALRTGVSGGNGVYVYGASAFPTDTYNAGNYWVDVVFTPVHGSAVSGRITFYADGAPVPDAALSLQGAQGPFAAGTDSAGDFGFDAVSPGTWQLEPSKQGDFRRAVSALDAAYVLQAVAGTRSFDALERMACDVTANGTLSTLDATRILQFAVGAIDQLPAATACGSDWLFVPEPLVVLAGQQLLQPTLDAGICQPGAILYNPLAADVAQQDFTALLIGDCTGNWSTSPAGGALRQRGAAPRAWLGAPRRRQGHRWLVPVYLAGRTAMHALEAHLTFDSDRTRLAAVDLVGAQREALVALGGKGADSEAVAVASAEPIPVGNRPVAVVSCETADRAPPQLRLTDVTVDDAAAVVDQR